MVLDLRFNGGGYVVSSDLLTSLIVKDLPSKVGTVMNKKVYNNAYTAVLKKETNSDQYLFTNFKSESANHGRNTIRGRRLLLSRFNIKIPGA